MEPREALPKDVWDSQLSAITPLMVDEYLSKRTTERKPTSVNKESQLLHHMFKKAMEWGQAIGNPITHVEPLPVNNRRLRYLSQRELMGHKTIAMTLRYAHLARDFQRDAINRLDTSMDTTRLGHAVSA
jgi:site-specific recombinase XerD